MDVESIIVDALKDSALVFAFVFLIHLILSYFENPISNFLVKHKRTSAIYGSLFGLIPQCGTSVIGADLYIKKYISLGTIVAIFLSCSDEAFIVILTSNNSRLIYILPLIAIKFVTGVIVGILIDVFYRKQQVKNAEKTIEKHTCHVHDKENTKLHQHLIHPLLHSLEIFAYVLIINLALGFIIASIGEDNFTNFLDANKYLTPLYSCIIGLIPNCASSLLISELFIEGKLSFGALVGGLLVNSGLGMLVLIKNRHQAKNVLLILAICLVVALITSYSICLITNF